jgi:hypothetical protein
LGLSDVPACLAQQLDAKQSIRIRFKPHADMNGCLGRYARSEKIACATQPIASAYEGRLRNLTGCFQSVIRVIATRTGIFKRQIGVSCPRPDFDHCKLQSYHTTMAGCLYRQASLLGPFGRDDQQTRKSFRGNAQG